jgi:alanine transaminase
MVTPPSKEEGCTNETIENHFAEREALLSSLKRCATMTTEIINSVKGVSC